MAGRQLDCNCVRSFCNMKGIWGSCCLHHSYLLAAHFVHPISEACGMLSTDICGGTKARTEIRVREWAGLKARYF